MTEDDRRSWERVLRAAKCTYLPDHDSQVTILPGNGPESVTVFYSDNQGTGSYTMTRADWWHALSECRGHPSIPPLPR